MSNIDLYRAAAKKRRIEGFNHVAKSTYTPPEMKLNKIKGRLGGKIGEGQNVAVYKMKGLGALYRRRGLCIKVFKNSKTTWGYSGVMGESNIYESTIVQNLLAAKGLAPRVYDLVEIGGKVAQVTDLVTGSDKPVPIKDDRFTFVEHELLRPNNFLGGKLLDFQGAIFKDFHKTKKAMLNRAHTHTSFPRTELRLYQSTDYCDAKRETKGRLSRYKFPSFEGKTVFDIGCNLGMLMRAAEDNGAKRVVGIDWPDMVDIAEEVAIMDGRFNLDFVGGDLKKLSHEQVQELTGIKRFDIHFFFAMEMWIGWPEWVKDCDTLFYEGHGVERPFWVKDLKSEK